MYIRDKKIKDLKRKIKVLKNKNPIKKRKSYVSKPSPTLISCIVLNALW